jgi:hypothetical protein
VPSEEETKHERYDCREYRAKLQMSDGGLILVSCAWGCHSEQRVLVEGCFPDLPMRFADAFAIARCSESSTLWSLLSLNHVTIPSLESSMMEAAGQSSSSSFPWSTRPDFKTFTLNALKANKVHQYALTEYAGKLSAELEELETLLVRVSVSHLCPRGRG